MPPSLAETWSWADGAQTLREASGAADRVDPVLPRTGGPAGNRRLTAWTGLVLLLLFLVELVTVLDVRGLISWHVVVGCLLIPPALLKTGSTGWRMVRYYTGNDAYHEAGPPPMLLRLLGPLVVLSTLAVLGTGLALVLIGPDRGRSSILVPGLSVLFLHKGSFVVWCGATGLHVLGRIVPALRIVSGKGASGGAVSGRGVRIGVITLAVATAALLALLVSPKIGAWHLDRPFDRGQVQDR